MLGRSLANMNAALETLSLQIGEERAKAFLSMSECACVFTVRTVQNPG